MAGIFPIKATSADLLAEIEIFRGPRARRMPERREYGIPALFPRNDEENRSRADIIFVLRECADSPRNGGVVMTVGDRMTKNPVTVSPRDTLVSAQEKMRAGEFRQIPVVDQGRLVGILTDRDIRKYGRHNIVASVQSAMTEGAITATPTTPL